MRSSGKNRMAPMELPREGQAIWFRRTRLSWEEKCEQDQEKGTEKTELSTLEHQKRLIENDAEDSGKRECRGRKTKDQGPLGLKKTRLAGHKNSVDFLQATAFIQSNHHTHFHVEM